MEKQINVTIFNEYIHETSDPEIGKIYPHGIHGAIAEMLGRDARFNIRIATLQMHECGLTDEVLASTDVLFWWGHCAHDKISDELARKVADRVLDGMGFIVLHSGHFSKPFKLLMGTCCRSKWRENDEKERIWVIDPSHPIASGLPEYIELEKEETYGERFEIPTPDELVFISWFAAERFSEADAATSADSAKYFISDRDTRHIRLSIVKIFRVFFTMQRCGRRRAADRIRRSDISTRLKMLLTSSRVWMTVSNCTHI